MRKTDRWKFVFVVLVVLWSLFQIYPPKSRDLIRQFESQAQNQDTNFTAILKRLAPLEAANTNREFANLKAAIGTNDIQNYFPNILANDQLHPTTFILNQIQRNAAGKIKLGLDLQGGTEFLVEMDTNKLVSESGDTNQAVSEEDISGALSQAVEVLRKRVDAFGVAEPVIQPAGGNRILIQLPGLSEADKDDAETNISKAAYLEFRMVKDENDDMLENGEPIPPGYELLRYPHKDYRNGKDVPGYIVKKKPENGLFGAIVKSARMGRGQMGDPLIEFTLTDDGSKKFAQTTRQYAPDPQTGFKHSMAIILDGELYSAPEINGEIDTPNAEISGHFTEKEAQDLASIMQNPLRAPLHIVYSKDVSATLGVDTIHHGIYASIAAVVFVSLFMLAYYWTAGLTANVALVTNIIILLGVMCSIGTTLTLPGIAGVVLTIGMAVDANVLIYERLREEIAKGKSLRGAIDAGYARAFGTIFDSHVTTSAGKRLAATPMVRVTPKPLI